MKKTMAWKSVRGRRMKEHGAQEAYEEAALAFALAEQVRMIREDRGLSQSDLATAMGTTQSAVARLEAGGVSPTIPTLKKLADALGLELLLGFNDPRASKRKKKPSLVAARGTRVRTAAAKTTHRKAAAKTTALAKRAAAKTRTVTKAKRSRAAARRSKH